MFEVMLDKKARRAMTEALDVAARVGKMVEVCARDDGASIALRSSSDMMVFNADVPVEGAKPGVIVVDEHTLLQQVRVSDEALTLRQTTHRGHREHIPALDVRQGRYSATLNVALQDEQAPAKAPVRTPEAEASMPASTLRGALDACLRCTAPTDMDTTNTVAVFAFGPGAPVALRTNIHTLRSASLPGVSVAVQPSGGTPITLSVDAARVGAKLAADADGDVTLWHAQGWNTLHGRSARGVMWSLHSRGTGALGAFLHVGAVLGGFRADRDQKGVAVGPVATSALLDGLKLANLSQDLRGATDSGGIRVRVAGDMLRLFVAREAMACVDERLAEPAREPASIMVSRRYLGEALDSVGTPHVQLVFEGEQLWVMPVGGEAGASTAETLIKMMRDDMLSEEPSRLEGDPAPAPANDDAEAVPSAKRRPRVGVPDFGLPPDEPQTGTG
jgi:hypothetical protein